MKKGWFVRDVSFKTIMPITSPVCLISHVPFHNIIDFFCLILRHGCVWSQSSPISSLIQCQWYWLHLLFGCPENTKVTKIDFSWILLICIDFLKCIQFKQVGCKLLVCKHLICLIYGQVESYFLLPLFFSLLFPLASVPFLAVPCPLSMPNCMLPIVSCPLNHINQNVRSWWMKQVETSKLLL